MSDDWTERYVEQSKRALEEKSQREQDARTRRDYAEGRASEFFQDIRKRIEHDVQMLRVLPMFQSVGVQLHQDGKFDVSHLGSPKVALSMELRGTIIKCEYGFGTEGSAKGNALRKDQKTWRICSDIEGNLTVHRNGDAEPLDDLSEISELLLKPILDHIKDSVLNQSNA